MQKIAVIIYGPPGSGKGTQANLLADKLNLLHFDTGKFLEALLHDPKRQKEKIIRRERRLFDTGKLVALSFFRQEVMKNVERIRKAGWGIVFSGSPRTLYEVKGLLPLLEQLYGRRNVFVFEIKVPPKTSITRNSSRRICSACKMALLAAYYPAKNPRHCPLCGGSFRRRTLDTPKVIKVRLAVYTRQTKPVIEWIRRRGYRVPIIDGTPKPYLVFRQIARRLPAKR